MQNQKDYNVHNIDVDDTINIRAELEKYLIYWKWFVLGVVLAITGAFLYIRYTAPAYSAKAVILIKENKKGGVSAELKAFEDLGILGGSTNNVDNEIEIIKSRKIVGDVLKKLDFNVSYFSKGRVKESEIYPEYSPVLVTFINKDSLFYQQDTIFSVKPLSSTKYQLISEDGNTVGTHRFNEIVSSKTGSFKVQYQPQKEANQSINIETKVAVYNLNRLIDSYQKSVSIAAVNKNASVITLQINSSVKRKAEDFLNNLIDLYNADAVDDKNQVAKKTKEFIDARLDVVGKNLAKINGDLKDFKTTNKITNIEAESELVLKSLSDNTGNIVEAQIQLATVKELNKNLGQEKGKEDELLATNLGINDVSIATAIDQYNKLLLDKKRLLQSATKINPGVVQLTKQIKAIKQSLNKSLKNLEKGLQVKLKGFQEEQNKIRSRISGVPTQELIYTGIKLRQDIIAAQYTYLLKKKEDTDISLAVTVSNAKIVDEAYSSEIPVSPKKKIIYLAALLLGGLIPFIIIYLINLLDTKIHNKKDIEENVSVPFLGDVPKVPKSEAKSKIVVGNDVRSATSEAFRLIRTNLDFMLANSKTKSNTIFITSTTSGEGKSFISLNLSATLALSGKKVLLIGMDLRAPKITEYLNIPDRKGVTNYITDDKLDIDDLIFTIDGFKNLDIFSSGAVPPNPAELLMNKRVENLFTIIKDQYDYIIVDTAPVNLVTDTLLLSKYADMFLYVARANYLDKRLLEIPNTLYKEKRLKNMAIVLNDTDPKRSYGYGYGGYGYGYVVQEKPWYQRIFTK